MRGEFEKINKEKERAEAEKAAVRQNEANNWLESSRIRRVRTEFEIKIAIIKRNLEKRELQVREQEDQRRSHQQQQVRVAATKSMAIIAGGTSEQKADLRDALLPRLDQASPLLCEVASYFSKSSAHDLVVDCNFIQLFRILRSEDARVREPIIIELRDHIQGSDETARRSLVDAGILPAHGNQDKDDLLSFMTTCVLPILGSSFTQSNGGSTLFPLLTNEDSRIRSAAIQALKNAVDSRHGNVENMAKAEIVETLYPLTAMDEAIRDLWCHILPKVAPLLTNRTEIDILFEDLKYVVVVVVRRMWLTLSSQKYPSKYARGGFRCDHHYGKILGNLPSSYVPSSATQPGKPFYGSTSIVSQR